jgi:uncharacterized protein
MERSWTGPALRVGFFGLTGFLGLLLWGTLLSPLGLLVTATLSVFGSGAVASALSLRIYEAGRLTAIGFGWHGAAGRHLLYGLGIGAMGIVFVLGIPLLIGKAYFVATPETPFNPGSLAMVAVCLLFGAIGEELLFRGYAFQVLAGTFGTYKVLLPLAALFALMHAGNQSATPLGLFNTFLWGVLLGYALLRSGDLWLPIGLHFGWNVTTPLFGVNLSGFTMGLTGYTVQWKASDLWSGGGYGPEGSVLCTLACLGVGYSLHRIPIVRQRLPLLPEED